MTSVYWQECRLKALWLPENVCIIIRRIPATFTFSVACLCSYKMSPGSFFWFILHACLTHSSTLYCFPWSPFLRFIFCLQVNTSLLWAATRTPRSSCPWKWVCPTWISLLKLSRRRPSPERRAWSLHTQHSRGDSYGAKYGTGPWWKNRIGKRTISNSITDVQPPLLSPMPSSASAHKFLYQKNVCVSLLALYGHSHTRWLSSSGSFTLQFWGKAHSQFPALSDQPLWLWLWISV